MAIYVQIRSGPYASCRASSPERGGMLCCAAQALSIHPLTRTVFANGVYYPSLVLNVMEYFIFMKYAK